MTCASFNPPPAKYAAETVTSALPPIRNGPSLVAVDTSYSGRRNSSTRIEWNASRGYPAKLNRICV